MRNIVIVCTGMRRRVTTVGNLLIHFPCLIGIATMHQTPTYEAEAKTRQSACSNSYNNNNWE